MKIVKRFITQLLMVSLVLSFNINVQGFTSKNRVGKITVNSQPVSVYRQGKQIRIGGFGLNLKKGDEVVSEKGGTAEIVLKSGNKIYVGSATRIKLTEEVIGKSKSLFSRMIFVTYGKIRAKIQKTRRKKIRIRTLTAIVGVKGTDFVTEYKEETTTVGTMTGLVNLASIKTRGSVDIPPGQMASISPMGEVMPLEEFAGELLKGFEFTGEKMEEDDISGERIPLQ